MLRPLTRTPTLPALAAGPGLAGCGYSPGDRAVSGGRSARAAVSRSVPWQAMPAPVP